jgi:hypothetical protein
MTFERTSRVGAAPLAAVEFVDEPAGSQLIDEAQVDKILGPGSQNDCASSYFLGAISYPALSSCLHDGCDVVIDS